jgi:type II secretory pathway pseudopilin PulG
MAVIFIVGILGAVVIFASGGISNQAEVAECTADASSVQNAISAYNSESGGSPVVTPALLTTGHSPILKSFPSSPDFSISIVAGVEMVAAPSSAPPAAYGTDGVCWGHAAVVASPRVAGSVVFATTTTKAP